MACERTQQVLDPPVTTSHDFTVGPVGEEHAAATRAAADTSRVSERRIDMVVPLVLGVNEL